MTGGPKSPDDLAQWLEEGYTRSFRTACLLLGSRADAEEAVQEAFLRAWRFRASLGTGSNLQAWLYRVVVNTCCSKLRQEIPHRERRSGAAQLEELASTAASPEEEVWQAEVSRDVLRALHDLPLHLRVTVVLRYYGNLSERDIAIAIGRRPGTVKSRLHEARRLLAAHPGLRALVVDAEAMGEEALR
jgi:RNA polymerase sigma-70 factor (ECF subfamily)